MKERLDDAMINYYTSYYKDALGIPDYSGLVATRLMEDDNYKSVIDKAKKFIPFFCEPVNFQKVLIVGAGTGQEYINFARMGYDVYGIEPNEKACDIIKMKCEYYKLKAAKVYSSECENLPFEDSFFDLIWAWTALEHVRDISQSFSEINRVSRPGGWVFLAMPDTRQFWEGHYKLYLPMFLPRTLSRIILKLKGRPDKFLVQGINRITTRGVRNILQHLNFDSMIMFHPWTEEWKKKRSFGMNLVYWMTVLTGIQRDQWWILRKRELQE